jgi:hypothetical protein
LNKITTNTTTKQINVNSNYKRSGKHWLLLWGAIYIIYVLNLILIFI